MKSLLQVARSHGSQEEPCDRALSRWPSWSVSALLTALAVAIFAVPGLAPVLEFDREQLWDSWRVLTGHFTHFDLRHLFWDGIMFLVLGAMIEKRGRGRLVGCLALSAVAIPLAVALWVPEIPTYRGLSGIDSALFTLAMGLLLREALAEKRGGQVILFAALALGFVGKVIYEFLTGHTFFVDSSSFTPLPLAHVVGAVIGLVFAVGKNDPGSVLPGSVLSSPGFAGGGEVVDSVLGAGGVDDEGVTVA